MNYHVSVTHYKRPYDAQMAQNRSTLDTVLALSASNRDNTVFHYIEEISPYTKFFTYLHDFQNFTLLKTGFAIKKIATKVCQNLHNITNANELEFMYLCTNLID